jgi:predicted NBD/HSP70 family sugar kinase
MTVIAGLDIGGTKTVAVLTDAAGAVLSSCRVPTSSAAPVGEGTTR